MTSLRTAIILILSCLATTAQQLEWRAAIAGNATTTSSFTAVESLPEGGVGTPPRAFACGFFVGNFNIGPGTPLGNGSGQDGVVVRLSDDPGWDVDWKAHASSTGNVEILDISIAPNGDLYVCGNFTNNIQFVGSAFNFINAGGPHGFVARLDPDSGGWTNAYLTSGIRPVSLVAGPSGNVLLTGPGTLAALFNGAGVQQWSATVPSGTTEWAHVAVGPTGDDAYVMTRRPDGSSQDVSLTRIDLTNSGSTIWTRIMGSPGPDFPGGLDVASDGDVRLTFTADHPSPTFNGVGVPGAPLGAAIHTIMVRVRPEGFPEWIVPVGEAGGVGSMTTSDLDCDGNGNAWIAAKFSGTWQIESVNETGNEDAALIAVDGTGLLYEFQRSTGNADEKPLGVAAPTRALGMLVGEYSGNGSTFPRDTGNLTLNNTVNAEAFISVADPIPTQSLTVFRPVGPTPPTLQFIIDLIHSEGGQVYAVVENPITGIAVSAWVTPSQASDINGNPGVDSEPESTISINASKTDAGWALGRLNDPSSATTSPYSFSFPDTPGEVVVYLIDTAIDELGGWFSANTHLTLEGSTLIRGAGDPTRSSAFEHGTQMLSLIAGPEVGAAPSTPIRLVNYDIYPSGTTTTSALLADALLEVISQHNATYPCQPGLICIASSSTSTASSITLSAALSAATSAGLPVVLSAGNSGDDAALYVPQRYAGSGVLCVGASNVTNTTWADSNYGTPVDFYAPGEAVRIIDYTSPSAVSFDSFDGTSASAALTTAVAAAHLSVNPWQSPSELEAAVLADVSSAAVSSTHDLVQLSGSGPSFTSSFSDWASWFGLATTDTDADSDGDNISDGLEFVLGLDPCHADEVSQTSYSFDGTTSEFGFTLNAVLYDSADPTTLLDGTTWEVKSSGDLATWATAAGSFSFDTSGSERVSITLTDTPTDTECFLRLEVTPAP